ELSWRRAARLLGLRLLLVRDRNDVPGFGRGDQLQADPSCGYRARDHFLRLQRGAARVDRQHRRECDLGTRADDRLGATSVGTDSELRALTERGAPEDGRVAARPGSPDRRRICHDVATCARAPSPPLLAGRIAGDGAGPEARPKLQTPALAVTH